MKEPQIIEITLGVGTNQLFPEKSVIIIDDKPEPKNWVEELGIVDEQPVQDDVYEFNEFDGFVPEPFATDVELNEMNIKQ